MQSSIRYAVNHIATHGDTDVFPFPIENHIFRDNPDGATQVLVDVHNEFDDRLHVEAPLAQSALSPVGYTGFRWATQLDPMWNAYLLALTIALAPRIESARAPEDVVFSHRFKRDDESFNLFARNGYLAFQEASRESASECRWVVATDIADFYARVYHHRLENALRDVDTTSDTTRVMKLLGFWSSGTSYGLPIGGPAARTLSEALLTRTDQLLMDLPYHFHRYADDYRFFVDSKQSAHRALAELSNILVRNEGLALSRAKTRIMTRAEFLSTLDAPEDQPDDDGGNMTTTQRDRRRRARNLLGLTLRYDPYSTTAVEDYEALKEAVDRLDIEDLFMAELSKPRIDPRLTRKLLQALQAAEMSAKVSVCSSLVHNLELLATYSASASSHSDDTGRFGRPRRRGGS